ncbi:hypothetical protein pEaSNUABM54_00271 [Erwinia phage pEa_SNUABM_54]|nr:hypothetical protein pEaSNUABM54_00271 [Erwinia phage pEa_SNUABM_54]
MRVTGITAMIDLNDLPIEYGICQELTDFDREIAVLTCSPTIVNDIDSSTLEGKEKLNSLLITNYKGDALPILPTCDCGKYQGEQYVGTVCEECNFMVTSPTEKPIESNVWIAAPEGVLGLINPAFWAMFSKLLTVNNTNILEWCVNSSYRAPVENLQVFDILSNYIMRDGQRFKRGLNNFIDNFDGIIELLTDGKTLRNIAPAMRVKMREFCVMNRGRIFCQYLPIPNKLAIVMEHTPTGTYSNETAGGTALDAVRSIASIYATALPVTATKKENRCVLATKQLAGYFSVQFTTSLGTKKGWNRKHGVGTRQDFSFRCVIASITEPHYYEECHLPWGVAVGIFTVHLSNFFLKQGLAPNEIERRLHFAVTHYDEEIDGMFKKIIADSDGLGPAIILNRNPTLSSKSIQLLQITKVKTDVKDVTLGISVLILNSFNADFDGRALPSLNASNCWELLKVA